MTLRLPDFVIAGAPRSGTTWLTSALERHPEVWLARPLRPEPKFFLVDDLYAQGLEEYSRRWFGDVPDGVAAGEKSTNYLESPVAADRMARDLPDVRLLFCLRDPVDRAVSNYRWSVTNGMESQDFATALRLEEEREAHVAPELRYARPHAYVSRGRYAELLRPWLRRFDREQVLVIRFEDLVEDSGSTLARVHAHLGVAPRPELVGDLAGVNASTAPRDVEASVLDELRAYYAPLNDELRDLLGDDFPGWHGEE